MPIYAYRCAACGHSRDVLQKLSDAPLTDCPACGAAQFTKQVTAAGFQLKGSGWYATDFKNGGSTSAPAVAAPAAPTGGDAPAAAPAAAPPSGGTSGSTGGSAASSTGSSSGGSCGGGCACH